MDIDDVLQFCNLDGMFPGRLQRQDMFSVQVIKMGHRKQLTTTKNEFAFLQKIVFHNEHCRKVNKRTGSCQPHPLDISTAVFLCCNFIARQDLVLHFWGCKHAFPVVVKTEQLESPTLYIWPIKTLIANCYGSNGNATQRPVLDFNMKVVCAIRFGQQTISKSNILNMIITKSDKEHSFFFHRDLEGTTKHLSEICNGMVEACPILTSEEPPSLYLNLRGDCRSHSDQLKFVINASDIIVLLCNKEEIDEVKSFLQSQNSICKSLLLIFCTDLSISEEDVCVAVDLEEFCKQRSIVNLIVALEGLVKFDWMNDVVSAISYVTSGHSIKNLIQIAEADGFYIDLDRIKLQSVQAEDFTNQILKFYNENQTRLIFPIQGQESIEWAKADTEIYKLRCWTPEESVRLYRDKLEQRKEISRLKQLELIKEGKSFLTFQFLMNIGHIHNRDPRPFFTSDEHTEIFLRSLKLNLENATRSKLNIFYNNYATLLSGLRLDSKSADIQTIDDLDMKINDNSLSISQFIREMGQIYETIVSQCQKEEDKNFHVDRFPSAAVTILLYGYHVELMDGRLNYVPLNWIKGIMYELQRILGNIKLKVVSVLGVQSTGKSTLLNMMFGSQFAEGSGRCTRGVYLHVVKVSPDCREEFNCDYLFVIDTEGLFSLPLESERTDIDRKDRELATFVIGISNITIINIMGENLSYLADILPISVHAFLRMDLVGLNPNCVLLHQNVAKGNKYHLLQQTHQLESMLDDYTSAACKLENVRSKRFKDIIKFDITNDVYYFPPLYQSPHDMVNPQFSEDVENLRNDIMAKAVATVSLLELTEHIGYIWNAVKRDNFVFEFKNTIELKARTIIDRAICNAQWKLRTSLQEAKTEIGSELINSTTAEVLIQIQEKFETKIYDITNNFKEECCIRIIRQIPSTIIGKSILKFQKLVRDSITRSFDDSLKEFSNLFKIQIRKKQRELEIIKCNELVLCEIDSFLEENLSENEISNSNNKGDLSDTLFRNWMQSRQSEYTFSNSAVLEEDASSCLFTSFPTRHAKINEKLEEKCISDRNLSRFLCDIPSTYWSGAENLSEQHMANEIVNNMRGFLECKLKQIYDGDLDYRVEIFKDIVLYLRNHRYFTDGLIHTKPVFEIDLAMSSCGEFIEGVKLFDQKHQHQNRLFKMHFERYFQSKIHEIVLHHTDLSEAIENFSDFIMTELEHYIVCGISQEIAFYLRNENHFLSSKQALLIYIYQTLLENLELPLIRICVYSFDLSARSCVSKLFDSLSGIDSNCSITPLDIIIEEYFDKITTSVCTRLKENTMNKQPATKSAMKQCIDLISSALDNFLPVNSIKVLENDLGTEIEPDILITMLVANLKKGSVRKKYLKKIMYRVLETEEYDKIRFETVATIISPLIGCTEKCPLCGEVCCIGQMNHNEKHRSLMHRPTGINGNCVPLTGKLSSLTCWEELQSHVHDKEHVVAFAQLRENWSVPSDLCVNDNSLWKFIYSKCVKEIAQRAGKDEPDDIPKSWYDLNKNAEVNKLVTTSF